MNAILVAYTPAEVVFAEDSPFRPVFEFMEVCNAAGHWPLRLVSPRDFHGALVQELTKAHTSIVPADLVNLAHEAMEHLGESLAPREAR